MNSRLIFLSVSMALVVLLCTCNLTGVRAYPQGGSYMGGDDDYDHHIGKRDDCSNNFGIRLLCERCAKYTKSNLAFKMCCDNKDAEVRQWCHAFLEYDIKSKK